MTNRLYYGDNLDVLRHSIASESVDLVYLDRESPEPESVRTIERGCGLLGSDDNTVAIGEVLERPAQNR